MPGIELSFIDISGDSCTGLSLYAYQSTRCHSRKHVYVVYVLLVIAATGFSETYTITLCSTRVCPALFWLYAVENTYLLGGGGGNAKNYKYTLMSVGVENAYIWMVGGGLNKAEKFKYTLMKVGI